MTEATEVVQETTKTPKEPETFSREYVQELRAENAKWRTTASEHGKARTKAEEDAAKAATEAEQKVTAASKAAEQRVIRAELRAEAVRAGMVDLDGLKLLDTDKITVDANGEAVIPEKFFEDAKKAKPWLFGTPGTSSTSKTPQADPPAPKNAREMTDDERRAALRKLGATKV